MSAVTDWITSLKSAIATNAPLRPVVRRVLIPGIQPLDQEGLVRFQGVEVVYRPGQTPESISVMLLPRAGEGEDYLGEAALAAEIGALLSLLTNRRIEVLEEMPTGMKDSSRTTFIGYSNAFDRRLVSPFDASNLNKDFRTLVSQIASLSEGDQAIVSAAIDLHYGSALLFEKDLSAAYTLVVAGIEAMSRRFGTPPTDWAAWEESTSWDKFAKREQLSSEQLEALKAKLMKNRHLRLKETFANYASQNLPESFWDQEWNEWLYNIIMTAEEGGSYDNTGRWATQKRICDYVTQDREVLRSALRRSYDARSGFVHSGNRTINVMSEFYGLTHETDARRPLSYASLRSILVELIKTEILNRASEYELPEIVLKAGTPPATS